MENLKKCLQCSLGIFTVPGKKCTSWDTVRCELAAVLAGDVFRIL